jgi:hypothetical protein
MPLLLVRSGLSRSVRKFIEAKGDAHGRSVIRNRGDHSPGLIQPRALVTALEDLFEGRGHCSLGSRSRPLSSRNWERLAVSSCRSGRRSSNTSSWCISRLGRAGHPIISWPLSIRRCSPTVRSSMCLWAFGARWRSLPISRINQRDAGQSEPTLISCRMMAPLATSLQRRDPRQEPSCSGSTTSPGDHAVAKRAK